MTTATINALLHEQVEEGLVYVSPAAAAVIADVVAVLPCGSARSTLRALIPDTPIPPELHVLCPHARRVAAAVPVGAVIDVDLRVRLAAGDPLFLARLVELDRLLRDGGPDR